MSANDPRARIAIDLDALVRAETLLKKYPSLTDAELAHVGAFLRSGAMLDIGLLSINEQLWKKAELFKREHPRYFRTTARGYAGWALFTTTVFSVIFFLWDFGVHY